MPSLAWGLKNYLSKRIRTNSFNFIRVWYRKNLRMRKVCTHLEHICVKNVLQCSFMHDNFTHFGYDCAAGCLQNEGLFI